MYDRMQCFHTTRHHLRSTGVLRHVDHIKTPDKESGRPYATRYIGSLVADFHRNLLYGGVFLYPATAKNPAGKLRLLYEGFPLAFIIEAAGGKATDGSRRILDIHPDAFHQRTPLVIGSSSLVDEATALMSEDPAF